MVGLGEHAAVTEDQHHVRMLNAVDNRDIVTLHRRLEFGVERGDRAAVVLGGGLHGGAHREQRKQEKMSRVHDSIRRFRGLRRSHLRPPPAA
ncbi:MAG TPA: hypothetical protein VFR77_03510 [Steroidobacteraceae bacterium]|nr:hypothetical protein [Steroidobacteraceae bacterium]